MALSNLPEALIFDFSDVLYSSDRGLNHELLDFLCHQIRLKFRLYVFTASTAWKKPFIHWALHPVFHKIISTVNLGSKADPNTFQRLAKEINVPVEKILLVDNAPENIEAVRQAGGQGITFSDNQSLLADFRRLGLV